MGCAAGAVFCATGETTCAAGGLWFGLQAISVDADNKVQANQLNLFMQTIHKTDDALMLAQSIQWSVLLQTYASVTVLLLNQVDFLQQQSVISVVVLLKTQLGIVA